MNDLPPIFNQIAVQGSKIKVNFKPDQMADSDWRTVVRKYVFLTKNIDKSVKFHQKYVKKLSKKHIHSVLGINLDFFLDPAWNFWFFETLGQPFRAKLEVSVSNPPTENKPFFSFKYFYTFIWNFDPLLKNWKAEAKETLRSANSAHCA